MRLLHIYGGNRYGGVERLLTTLAERAPEAPAVRQEFALCYDGRLRQELLSAGAQVLDLGGVRVSRPWQVLRARRRMWDLLAAQPPDLALCHAWWSYAIFAPALRRRRIPVALWAHNCATGVGWLEAWARQKRPEFAVTWGTHMAASLEAMFPGVRIEIWHPPVARPAPLAADARRRLRQELQTSDDAVVILQASRLEAWKGQRLLLDALAQLKTRRPWVAWIAGGAQRPEEERYAAELRLQAQRLSLEERVRWLGERSDVPELMQSADIFCQPNSRPEPFGLVFVEALAAGLPVVATTGGGASEIVTCECGALPEARAEDVAGALANLVDDEPRRRDLAQAAPGRARELCEPVRQMHDFQARIAGAGKAAEA